MASQKQRKILITGGAGFIGSNFIRYLYRKYPEYRLYNLDLLTYAGNQENLADIDNQEKKLPVPKRRYFFVHGDICNLQLVDQLLKKEKFDLLVNFAAESHVDRSIIDDYYFIRTNLLGVHNLIGLAKKHSLPRFVHISTDEIYGDVEHGKSTEDSPIRPSNPYSASKAAADLLVQSYMRTHQLPIVVVRGSNNFGPYQYPEKLIPLAITNILEGKKVPIHGDGQQRRSWIHVFDFCEAIDAVMHRGPDFGIYNAGGTEMTNLDVVRSISECLKRDQAKHISFVKDRPGGDRRYSLDAAKLTRELGWKPNFPIETSLVGVVAWYLENESWWREVKKKKDFKEYYDRQFKSEY